MEYGLFVIKPDGLRRKIEKDFDKLLSERNFGIVKKKMKQLTPQDIMKNYFFQSTANIQYLCDGPVKAYFVDTERQNSADDIYALKMDFRLRYGIHKNEFYNLLHSSDEGLEFYLQRKLFFREYDNGDYSFGTDMLIDCEDEQILANKLAQIQLNKNLSAVCVVVNSYQIFKMMNQFKALKIIPVLKTIVNLDQKTISLYHYFGSGLIINSKNMYNQALKQISAMGCTTVLGEILGKTVLSDTSKFRSINDPVKYLDEIYYVFSAEMEKILSQIMSQYFISGLLVDSVKLSIQEVACRYFFAEDHLFKKAAGSGLTTAIGKFCVSSNYYNNFFT